MTARVWSAGVLTLLLASACADGAPESTDIVAAPAVVTTRQALLDPNAPNWFVAGGPGLVELVGGSDGEPNELTGRFALDGRPIADSDSGTGRWIIAGVGLTQPLDDDGLRLAEPRAALSGEAIALVERGSSGWLIGGANGRLQLLDAQGEPTVTMIQVLGNAPINAAVHNGNAWLVGGDNGNVVVVNDSLAMPAAPDGNVADAGQPIRAIAADPTGALSPPFLAFTDTSAIAIGAVGAPQATTALPAGAVVTTAEFDGGKVLVGTNDGRVGIADYGPTPSFVFTSAFTGAAVTKLVSNGTEWLALGANGQARRFDTNGSALATAVQISSRTDRPLVGAHWTGTRWLLVVGAIGFVAFVDDALASPRTLTPVLGGAQIRGASAGDGQVLVVGAAGAFQVLDELGATVTAPESVAGGANLNAAAWNGDHWLVVGDGGLAQVVDAQGNAVGSASTLLAGNDIRFAAWSGQFFLIGGEAGNVQVARSDATQSAAPFVVAGATDLYDARWSGRDWLVVGTDGTNGVFTLLVDTDTSATATVAPGTQTFRAVDFNGLEWLLGGDGGLIQRVSAQGATVDVAADVLTGFSIRDLHFNGVNYIVAGAYGSVRRLGQDYLPLRTPIAVLDREDAAVVLWTTPRGFARGPCLTSDLCYEGPCVGGIADGRCCDAACDRPCESCFENDTGQADGVCAPVVAGKLPPVKEGSAGCQRQSEQTCGFTGSCDGAGECDFYGAEIECAEAVCSLGRFTEASVCDGAGSCGTVAEQDCTPYAGCNVDGCVTSCNADQDCAEGYRCDASSCVAAQTDTDMGPGDEGPPDEKGCCTTVHHEAPIAAWPLFLALVIVVRRRFK